MVATSVEAKTRDIVAAVNATMESLLKQSEVNLRNLINSKANKSMKDQIQAVKESLTRDNQILADEQIRQDIKSTSFLTRLKEQLNALTDVVKKEEE